MIQTTLEYETESKLQALCEIFNGELIDTNYADVEFHTKPTPEHPIVKIILNNDTITISRFGVSVSAPTEHWEIHQTIDDGNLLTQLQTDHHTDVDAACYIYGPPATHGPDGIELYDGVEPEHNCLLRDHLDQ